jgi:transcriptional regulator with XRE-family HTH domain
MIILKIRGEAMATTSITAQLVDSLFKTHLKPDGQEYSYQEVSQALGRELDPSYLAKVRRGVIKNPGRDALMHLCLFFQVPASYFFPELAALAPEQQPREEESVQTLRVAFRSMNLSPDVQKYLEGIIAALRNQDRVSEDQAPVSQVPGK